VNKNKNVLPDPQDEGTTILRSVGTGLPVDPTARPKRLKAFIPKRCFLLIFKNTGFTSR
jgi:hypothetical protein